MFFRKKPSSSIDFIVAGLGNPGAKYFGSRHNIGFAVLDLLAARHRVRVDRSRFKALTGELRLSNSKILLMKPQIFMNLSGQAIKAAMDFYHLPPERVIVIYDDVSLPVGKLRIRAKGSAGGHNGIKSIISLCGDVFPRVKVGVGENQYPDLADWVLGRFPPEQRETIGEASERAASAVECIIESGAEAAANRFN